MHVGLVEQHDADQGRVAFDLLSSLNHQRQQLITRSKLMKQFHRRIERLPDVSQREARLERDINPADAAFLVIGLVQGLVLRWSLSGRDFDLAAEEADLWSESSLGPSAQGSPGRSRSRTPSKVHRHLVVTGL